METSELDYDLPPELVAQRPVEPRDSSRLLVYRRKSGAVEHTTFSDLPDLVDDRLLVVNDTRVVPARLHLRRATGAAVEVLLVESLGDRAVGGARATVPPASDRRGARAGTARRAAG